VFEHSLPANYLFSASDRQGSDLECTPRQALLPMCCFPVEVLSTKASGSLNRLSEITDSRPGFVCIRNFTTNRVRQGTFKQRFGAHGGSKWRRGERARHRVTQISLDVSSRGSAVRLISWAKSSQHRRPERAPIWNPSTLQAARKNDVNQKDLLRV
jgi:hypothetical protein